MEINKDNLSSLIDNEVTNKLIDSNIIEQKTIDELLKNLSNTIGKIDFETVIYPENIELKKQLESLKPFVFNEDNSLRKDNLEYKNQYNVIEKKLNRNKLTRNHYIITCIEQLLTIAETNNWGLCRKNGFIYLYNGCYWVEIDKERFQFFLGNVGLKMGIEKFTGKIHSFKEELFKQFMADSYLSTPPPKSNCVLINLQNGTYEITPNKRGLRAFAQSDFITHQLPFEYDHEAKAPLFEKFINEVLPDTDKQKVFAEYLGYIFIKPSVLKLEKMLILYGSGANGKSVCFEVLKALLGNDNMSSYSLQSLTNDNGYYRAKIGNKLVNYASEINGKLETDVFKLLASGEPIEARLPYGDPFILYEYAKLIFNCNELPTDVEHTNAYFRRFTIIHFDQTISEEKQDKELAKKIINNELSGVFNWILQGLDRLLKQKKFSNCIAIDNARSDYEKQSDSVKLFLDEYNYTISKDYFTLISELYPIYKGFCIEDGYRPVGKSNFIKRLQHHKVYVTRINLGNVAYITKSINFQ